jgi:uncharacterized membrane protein YjgN (DUF898 family)
MSGHALTPAFHGNGGSLFGIHIKNLLLTIVTLGIYTFWGRTRVREYLYGQTEFDGDRLAYHGTGGELFKGWLKAMGLLLVLVIAAGFVIAVVNRLVGVLLFYAVLFCGLFPLALIGARKYRLSRTSWRGIRFSFRGEFEDFLEAFIPGVLLTTITLGVYYPFFHVNVRRFLVDHSHFGTEPFQFDGEGRDLLGPHVLAMLLTPITLGIYWFWYAAFRNRYYWSHTALDAGRFVSTVTGGGLLKLTLVNMLLLIVTLGIGYSWVQVRTIRYHTEHLAFEGPADLAAVRQEAVPAGATGEGLSQLMDVDLVGADFFGL